MKKKNNYRVFLYLGVFLLGFALMFFYRTSQIEKKFKTYHNEQIHVGQIKLWMTEDEVFNFVDEKPDEDMCVYGYEFNFEEAGLNLGFRMDDHTLRRITVKNLTHSLYGIQNGMDLATAKDHILTHGFSPDSQTNRYKLNDLYFTLVSKQGTSVDYMIIELIDEEILGYAQ